MINPNAKIYTASEARDNLYALIKTASSGLASFEITLQGSDSVILINKAELESWQETLDVLSNKKEITAIRKARKQKKLIPHKTILQSLRLP